MSNLPRVRLEWQTHPTGKRHPRIWLNDVELTGLADIVIRDKVGDLVRLELTILARSVTTDPATPENHP